MKGRSFSVPFPFIANQLERVGSESSHYTRLMDNMPQGNPINVPAIERPNFRPRELEPGHTACIMLLIVWDFQSHLGVT